MRSKVIKFYNNLDYLYGIFFQIGMEFFKTEYLTEYAVCSFIRSISKGNNPTYNTILESVNYNLTFSIFGLKKTKIIKIILIRKLEKKIKEEIFI